jgi:ferredoxin-type protein NapH
LVILTALAALAFHTGTGTLSSFGWEYIATICPLGGVEAFLASHSIFPRALMALVVVIILGMLLGKFFCSWLCPIPPLRDLLKRKRGESIEPTVERYPAKESAKQTEDENVVVPPGYHTCAAQQARTRRRKFDSRHIVLGGTLLTTMVFGFPVFCIICPVGLVFATIIAFWGWVGLSNFTLSIVVFPIILIVEILMLRKWCVRFCPLGAIASLMSLPNRFFRPKVNTDKCLRCQGTDCSICTRICEEGLDPHYSQGMHECSKCGLCGEYCPTQAITFPFHIRKTPDA